MGTATASFYAVRLASRSPLKRAPRNMPERDISRTRRRGALVTLTTAFSWLRGARLGGR